MDTTNTDIEIIEAEILPAEPVIQSKVVPQKFKTLDKDAESDYITVRNNLKTIAEKGSSALDDLLVLASQLDHPRAYEVIGQMIKSLSDTNRQIIELQKDMREIADEGGSKKITKNQTNFIFSGSTHELQKLIKGTTKIEDVPLEESE